MKQKYDIDSISAYYAPLILSFCIKRLSYITDAEDLAQEILLEIIAGLKIRRTAPIENIHAWVWKIAKNRYARKINSEKKAFVLFSNDISPYARFTEYSYTSFTPESAIIERETHDAIFKAVMSLSELHRQIIVDFYVREMTVNEIAVKHNIPLNTVKTRLFYGKNKMKERFVNMDNNRIYDAVNWSVMCNGNFDPWFYLSRHISRAICLTAYEKPVSIDEISKATGIPAIYIEDEIQILEDGDAIEKRNGKYASCFLITTNDMRKQIESIMLCSADGLASLIEGCAKDYPFNRLPKKLLTAIIVREATKRCKNEIPDAQIIEFPARKDGGYGYFVVTEANENMLKYDSGCNGHGSTDKFSLQYFWTGYDFSNELNAGLKKAVLINYPNGTADLEAVSEYDMSLLLQSKLAKKENGKFLWNIPVFTQTEFNGLMSLPQMEACISQAKDILLPCVSKARDVFIKNAPKRVASQIRGNLGGAVNMAASMVILKLETEETQTDQVLLLYKE